jgi:hypothetical protein
VSLVGEPGRFEVAAGRELEVEEGGSVARRNAPQYGPDWDWFTEVTPMMEVQGRPVREFLEWMARERGWTLSFADTWTADRAASIMIDGSIDGLTLDQALDAVLRTTTLTHRVENGVLKIG